MQQEILENSMKAIRVSKGAVYMPQYQFGGQGYQSESVISLKDVQYA